MPQHHNPDTDEHEAAAEHEPKDLGANQPERHADANFLRALACGVRHYAVNADQRERQTEPGPIAPPNCAPNRSRRNPFGPSIMCCIVTTSKMGRSGSNERNHPLKRRCESRWISGGPQLEHPQRAILLLERREEKRHRIVEELLLLCRP
jgi:hypothetical protein